MKLNPLAFSGRVARPFLKTYEGVPRAYGYQTWGRDLPFKLYGNFKTSRFDESEKEDRETWLTAIAQATPAWWLSW
jgi:hypothetical protein